MAKINIDKIEFERPLLINKANNQLSVTLPIKQLYPTKDWEQVIDNLREGLSYTITIKIKSLDKYTTE